LRIVLAAAAAAALAVPVAAQEPPPPPASVPPSAPAPPPGEKLYADNCQACHQAAGAGVSGAFPALAASPFVQGDPAVLATTVLNGRGGMPAFKSELTDEQLAEVLSFMRGSWGNKAEPLTTEQVAAIRAAADAPAQPKDLQAH
jgi:mono/diheme cytochrome c family protein